jgi:hypothetical protein
MKINKSINLVLALALASAFCRISATGPLAQLAQAVIQASGTAPDYLSPASNGTFPWTNPTWQLPNEGRDGGVIEFYANRPTGGRVEDIYVAFKPTLNESNGKNWGYVILGGWGNTLSSMRTGANEQLFLLGDNKTPMLPLEAPGVQGTGCYFRIAITPNRRSSSDAANKAINVIAGDIRGHTIMVSVKGKNDANFRDLTDKDGKPFTFEMPANLGQAPWRYFSFSNFGMNMQYSQIKIYTRAAFAKVDAINAININISNTQGVISNYQGWIGRSIGGSDLANQLNNNLTEIQAQLAIMQDALNRASAATTIDAIAAARSDGQNAEGRVAQLHVAGSTIQGASDQCLSAAQAVANRDNVRLLKNLTASATAMAASLTRASSAETLKTALAVAQNSDKNGAAALISALTIANRYVADNTTDRARADSEGVTYVATGIHPAAAALKTALNQASTSNAVVVVPTGFDDEAGNTEAIAVGGNSIYCLSLDGRQLLWYNNDSMNPNPWEFVTLNGLPNVMNNGISSTVALEAVSCGGDDTLCLLDANGVVYRAVVATDRKSAVCTALPATAVPVARVITSIAVGNAQNIWAVDSDKNVLQHNGTDWVVRSAGVGIDVAAGADGHVVAINTAGDAFFFNNNAWAKLPVLPGDLNIDQIAVVKAGELYAVSEDDTLWHFVNNAWKPLKNATGQNAIGYSNVATNAGGTVFAITSYNEIYNTEVQFITVAPVAPTAAAPAVRTTPATSTIRTLEMQTTPAQAAAYNGALVNVAALPAATTTIGDVTVTTNVAIAKKPLAKGKQTRAQAKKAGKVNVRAHKAAVKKAGTKLVKAVNSKVKAVKAANKAVAKANKKVVKKAGAAKKAGAGKKAAATGKKPGAAKKARAAKKAAAAAQAINAPAVVAGATTQAVTADAAAPVVAAE